MKNLRSILTALAFVFAFTAAFALKADSSNFYKKLSNGTGDCIANQSLPSGCQTGIGQACEVLEAGGEFTYFELPGCVKPLVRP